MNNNQIFVDKMDNINNIAYGYNFKNGIEWANAAQRHGEIPWGIFKQFENAHNLRVRFAHGNARDIQISDQTLAIVRNFEKAILRSSLRGNRYNRFKDGPKLPAGTFRVGFTKEFRWNGKSGRSYYFRFLIVEEYQSRAYDDGSSFRGTGFSIYIQDSPYMAWCLQHNRDQEFHFYDPAGEQPSICWNKLITSFQEANAVMFVWAKRYIRILDQLLDKGAVNLNQVERVRKTGILPAGTFRHVDKSPRKVIHIDGKVYDRIMETLGTKKPELGGMLGWKVDQDCIDEFVFDKDARVGHSEYSPNVDYLMSVINNEWEEKHVFLGGFVHSHPHDAGRLSSADIDYAIAIMKAFDMDHLFMPIVTSSYSYKKAFHPYIVDKKGNVERCLLDVFRKENAEPASLELNRADLSEIEKAFDAMGDVHPVIKPKAEEDSVFARIRTCLDLDYLKDCTVIGIGCGGSKSFYESMARLGVGHFYLMDGDVSSLSNVASQNAYVSETGMNKTEALKKRLLNIHPDVDVTTFPIMLNDELDDRFLEENILNHVDPKKTVLCAFTDDFFAQARVSNIAQKYGIPFLCGQHHERGLTSEVVFWYPGIAKHSLEEIAKSRYELYRNGYKNDVTSVGSPIFNTTRLNALCEKIALGLLLHGNQADSLYSRFLSSMNDKNLILIREAPLTEDHPLFDLFAHDINSFFDDVVWINPESIEDCENGDASSRVIEDTRRIFS